MILLRVSLRVIISPTSPGLFRGWSGLGCQMGPSGHRAHVEARGDLSSVVSASLCSSTAGRPVAPMASAVRRDELLLARPAPAR
ncbi:MAG: hypothetical protein JWR32_3301 [Mycobacterium sp.]|nr:hypothetical protein [Mycobacterium sp.]